MRTLPTLLLATGVAFVMTAAGAEEPAAKKPYDPRAAFAETDKNHDGVIDHEEFQERLVDVFYSADANKDGFLDPTELKRLIFPDDFNVDDRNHDGRVSMHEFLRVRFLDYTSADTDGDGVLSIDEVVIAFEGKKRR